MKHTITDEVNANVNLNVNLPTQDLKELIETATDAALVVIAACTAAHILKSFFTA
jgi:hypothetical protein